ncbi:MAG: N-methyl-L-tryptophan oxidase [Chloroflexi bacterium]|nr:N-methyl-L-tryptophan oxidase [Chloroflexota bacterium]
MLSYDAIVVGLGAHGSAAAAALARRGQRVLGLERFGRGEGRGSSGGWTRMIRLSHFEHPWLVPMAAAAWDRWRALEAETNQTILTETGGLYAGPADSTIVTGATQGAVAHDLAYEILNAREIRERWPVLELADDVVGVLEAKAGALRADRGNAGHLAVAERGGAIFRYDARVVDWRPAAGGGFEVETADGTVVGAEHLVLTTGPWIAEFVPDLGLPLAVEREVPMWFRPSVDPASVGADRLPIWVVRDGPTMFYGIPYDPELGLKVSIHHWGTFVEPDVVDRVVGDRDTERVRAFLRQRMPTANGPLVHAEVCLYANTPDGTFVIDRHPVGPGVAFASACSGHGYKFAPVIGEILADLALDGTTDWPIEPFRVARFRESIPG